MGLARRPLHLASQDHPGALGSAPLGQCAKPGLGTPDRLLLPRRSRPPRPAQREQERKPRGEGEVPFSCQSTPSSFCARSQILFTGSRSRAEPWERSGLGGENSPVSSTLPFPIPPWRPRTGPIAGRRGAFTLRYEDERCPRGAARFGVLPPSPAYPQPMVREQQLWEKFCHGSNPVSAASPCPRHHTSSCAPPSPPKRAQCQARRLLPIPAFSDTGSSVAAPALGTQRRARGGAFCGESRALSAFICF